MYANENLKSTIADRWMKQRLVALNHTNDKDEAVREAARLSAVAANEELRKLGYEVRS